MTWALRGLNDAGQTNGPALTNAIAVAAGNKHSLALRDNGTVVAWGRNVEDQTNVPDGLTNVMAIAAGGNQSMALRKNGTVTNWGHTFGTIPTDLTHAIAIAAGTNFCLALRSNGTLSLGAIMTTARPACRGTRPTWWRLQRAPFMRWR